MLNARRVRPKLFFTLLALCGAFAAIPCGAADVPPPSTTPTPSSTLTRESARDLLSRMSDTEVRKMLLEQLDRAAAASPAAGATAAAIETAGRESGKVGKS